MFSVIVQRLTATRTSGYCIASQALTIVALYIRDNRRHGSVHHAARNTNGGIIPPPTVSLVPAFTIKAARLASYRAAVNLLTAVVVVAVLFYLS